MQHLLSIARLIAHLEDEGLITAEDAREKRVAARRLIDEGFDEHIIVEALFCWAKPRVREHIFRFDVAAHRAELRAARVTKQMVIDVVRATLDGDDLVAVERRFSHDHDDALLTPEHVLSSIPDHHPATIDRIIDVFLASPDRSVLRPQP